MRLGDADLPAESVSHVVIDEGLHARGRIDLLVFLMDQAHAQVVRGCPEQVAPEGLIFEHAVIDARRNALDIAVLLVGGQRPSRQKVIGDRDIDRCGDVAAIEGTGVELDRSPELALRRLRVYHDRAARRIPSYQGPLGAAQHFHAIQVDELPLQETRVGDLPDPVDVNADVGYAAHRERSVGDASPGSVKEHVRHVRGQVLDVLYVSYFEIRRADRRDGQRRVLHADLAPRGRDEDFFERAVALLCPRRRRRRAEPYHRRGHGGANRCKSHWSPPDVMNGSRVAEKRHSSPRRTPIYYYY